METMSGSSSMEHVIGALMMMEILTSGWYIGMDY